MKQADKVRVLQVTGGMNVGGAETWLMHVLRGIDRCQFQFDFLVFDEKEQAYEAEIMELGGRIIRAAPPSIGAGLTLEIPRIIRRTGPYEVMHCHTQHFSGAMLGIGRALGIPIRIMQSHIDSSQDKARASGLRRAYFRVMESAIGKFATNKLAVSDVAGRSIFGSDWLEDSRARKLYCGIDLEQFGKSYPTENLSLSLGVDRDAWVVGHVGRFYPQKNHTFIVDIAEVLAESQVSIQILLVGDGPGRKSLENRVNILGLQDSVLFAGVRDDTARLMADVMDVFILPSHYEGLPLVGMEAQAAGLPSLFSKNCSRELSIVDGLTEFLPIDDPRRWAERILEIRDSPPLISREEALGQMVQSPFNIEHGIKNLERLYSGEGIEQPNLGFMDRG